MGIRKLLVANRGEIAVRVFPPAGGSESPPWPSSRPTTRARSTRARPTRRVGRSRQLPRPGRDRRARPASAGADAVHPGYGFLAENARFAEAVAAAGLVLVGPPPAAIRAAGDKLEAKRLARGGGRPRDRVRRAGRGRLPADRQGGGRRRRARHARRPLGRRSSTTRSPRRRARRRPASATTAVFFERYVERPRHVEIQLLADAHGNGRPPRRARVLDPAPPPEGAGGEPLPALDAELRAAMGDAAVAFARAVGYENAGTAEFMLDGGRFCFLELNARLQVEHPVTELVTGARPRRAAAPDRGRRAARARTARAGGPRRRGAPLRRAPAHVPPPGRAGSSCWSCPTTVRVDAGVEAGDEIPVAYDPLIAKLSRARRDARRGPRRPLARAPRRPASRARRRTSASCAGSSTTRRSAPARRRPPSSPSTRRSRRPRARRGSGRGYWRAEPRPDAPRARPAPAAASSRAPPTRRTASTRRAR